MENFLISSSLFILIVIMLCSLIRVKGKPQDYFSAATTMTTEKNSLKQRIMVIAKKPRVVIPVCVLVVLAVGFGFLATITGKQSEIVSGTYYMEGSEDGIASPRLMIDAEEKSFVFSLDPLSSYLPVGSYTYYRQDGKLKGETEDGLYHITFEVDKETFKYLAEESKVPGVTDEKICAALYDGAVFRLVPEENETIMPTYTKEEIQQLSKLSVWEDEANLYLFVYDISQSEKAIDSWAFDYSKYEEDYYFDYNLARKEGEIPAKSLVFDKNAKFYVNETVGTTESTEVDFVTFADYIDSRSETSEEYGYEGAECLCEVKDGVIVSITLRNPYPYLSNVSTVSEDHSFYENYGVQEYYLLKNSYKTNLKHKKEKTDWIEVYIGNVGDGESGMVLVCSDDSTKQPFSIEAHTARAGWTNIYLVTIDEKDYIFELKFDSRDGYGECSYCLYYFGEQSETKLTPYMADGAAFCFNGEIEQDSYEKWAEKMEQYLKDAVLLLSTQDGQIRVEPENDYDRYNKEALLEILQTKDE